MIFLLYFVTLEYVKFGFWFLLKTSKTTLTSSPLVPPPSMQSSIERQMKWLEGSINIIHFLFLHLFEYFSIERNEALGGKIEVET